VVIFEFPLTRQPKGWPSYPWQLRCLEEGLINFHPFIFFAIEENTELSYAKARRSQQRTALSL